MVPGVCSFLRVTQLPGNMQVSATAIVHYMHDATLARRHRCRTTFPQPHLVQTVGDMHCDLSRPGTHHGLNSI